MRSAEYIKPQGLNILVTPQSYDQADLPTRSSLMLNLAIQNPSQLTLLRHPIAQMLKDGTGILTCCPSPTPIGLGLGID